MKRYYLIAILAITAAIFSAACEGSSDEVPCSAAQAYACSTFVPSSVPVCFDKPMPAPMTDGPFPAKGCASGVGTHGAPAPKAGEEGMWDWWCCVGEPGLPMVDSGPEDAPSDATMTFDSPTGM